MVGSAGVLSALVPQAWTHTIDRHTRMVVPEVKPDAGLQFAVSRHDVLVCLMVLEYIHFLVHPVTVDCYKHCSKSGT